MNERAMHDRRTDHAIGLGLGAAYVGSLLATARSLGFSRDEGFYFHAASDYARWFRILFATPGRAFERSVIDPIWASNHEHPSLMKSLFALSWMFLHEKWKIFADASTAFRFPGMLSAGLAIYVTYLFGARAFSRTAGVVAAVLLALMPRVFYHAHLACFDVPIMGMWTACIYVYWRAEQEGGIAWALFAGVMYGLTLETKHNAWMLPGVFVVHAFVRHVRRVPGESKSTVSIPASLVAMATVGPLLFLALWPWMWNDTAPRIQEYLNFHLNHVYYNIEFLGVTYFGPPSPKLYAPVMIVATVPAVTLLLFVTGAFERLRHLAKRAFVGPGGILPSPWRTPRVIRLLDAPDHEGDDARDAGETDLLLFLSFAVPIGFFFLPHTPVFGGTKHWITAYPFLAVFAGRGFTMAAGALHRLFEARLSRLTFLSTVGAENAVPAALGVVVALAPLAETAHSHPFGLSAYTPIVGGTAGAADIGLNRQFWGFTTESLAPYFEHNAPRNATVFFHDTAWDSWARLLDERRLRPDLRGVGYAHEAEFAIVHHEQHMLEQDVEIWMAYGSPAPDYVLTHDGVPIISVYKRR
jgi:hypothetical protein